MGQTLMINETSSYLGIARAPFLILPVTLVACGAAAGAYEGAFSWLHTVIALFGLLALHAAVNSLNEFNDMRTGIDLHTKKTPFSGGSGTLPSGRLTARQTMVFSICCCLIGLAVGIWFLCRIGWVLLPVILLGAICVLTYTDLLARVGLGEVAAGLGLGALPVIGTAMVQGGSVGTTAISVSLPAFFMTFNLLLLNEFPDEEADRRGGRKNLVILMGRGSAAWVYVGAALGTFVAILASTAEGHLPLLSLVAILPFLLLTKPLIWALKHPDSAVPISALGLNVVWILVTNLTLALTLAVSAEASFPS
jgi:1,4-dihydroxy-2-naphthoate octaprenyltransferase